MVFFINIADTESDIPGKTWREKNSEMKHSYPVGSLVEDTDTRVRLFIVKQTRDCDQSLMYSLCADKDDVVQERENFGNPKWHNGYPECCLKIIKPPL